MRRTASECALRGLHFAQSAGVLTLSWQAADGAYQMQSDDEGRSWQPLTKMITKN